MGGRGSEGRHTLTVAEVPICAAKKSGFWIDNEAKHRQLIEEGYNDRECAALLSTPDHEVTVPAARLKRQDYGNTGPSPQGVLRPMGQRPRLGHVLELDPQPFQVEIAKAPDPIPGKPIVAAVFGDTQIPFQDDKCLSVVEGILKQVKPDILLHMGDLVDCWEISDYERDPARFGNLQDDIDEARKKLHRWAQLAPKARRVLLEGNHEDRLRRAIWKLPGTARELARLRSFGQTMTWPHQLQLDGIGWEWIPGDKQSRTPILPKLISIHGHQLRGSITVEGATARKAIQKYGRSCIVGHHHRACVIARRDHNGQSFGIETGCTCLLDGQPYGVDFNWQNAVTLIEWSGDKRVMTVNQIHIRDGRALWRGNDIKAVA